MQCGMGRDLALLGCSEIDTWLDIRRAYRSAVRGLHGDLIAQAKGANERFALVNAAYDRLKAGMHVAAQPCRHPKTWTLKIDAATTARLKHAVDIHSFRLRLDATRDAATGTYGDPRCPGNKAALRRTALHRVTAAKLFEGTLEFEIASPLTAGRNILVMPELHRGNGGKAVVGSSISVAELNLSSATTRAELPTAALPEDLCGRYESVFVQLAA